MARKSRRKQNTGFIRQELIEKYVAGAYLRISVRKNEEQNSIASQKCLIDQYICNIPDIEIFKYYTDNGVSSFDKKRPAFQEMIKDIKSGAVNCIIVKDISRFGRDYIETGNYLESIFPFLGVRFISIYDGYDSLYESSSTLQNAFKNLINNFYSHDISKKVKVLCIRNKRVESNILIYFKRMCKNANSMHKKAFRRTQSKTIYSK
ncbi:MAG TPA: recombinase family protein [Ruminiclostridium sp.]